MRKMLITIDNWSYWNEETGGTERQGDVCRGGIGRVGWERTD